MGQALRAPEPLITGMRMDRDEFMRRWELLPELKNAELIEGIVFVASPVSADHGAYDFALHTWLGAYESATPGVQGGANATVHMRDSSPQPDSFLAILPECGGSARLQDEYFAGAPELIAEVSASSYSHDHGPKAALYQVSGVLEYITADTHSKRLIWRVLTRGSYREIQPDPDGVLRSRTFPGLWLDPRAFWKRDKAAVMSLLRRGLRSPEHKAFVAKLARRKSRTA